VVSTLFSPAGITPVAGLFFESENRTIFFQGNLLRVSSNVISSKLGFAPFFFEKAVVMVERNIDWLKIVVEDLRFHAEGTSNSEVKCTRDLSRFPSRKFVPGKTVGFSPSKNSPATGVKHPSVQIYQEHVILIEILVPVHNNETKQTGLIKRSMNVSFIGLRLTKTRLTLINRTRLRTKGQSAGYPQAQIGITSNFFQRRAP